MRDAIYYEFALSAYFSCDKMATVTLLLFGNWVDIYYDWICYRLMLFANYKSRYRIEECKYKLISQLIDNISRITVHLSNYCIILPISLTKTFIVIYTWLLIISENHLSEVSTRGMCKTKTIVEEVQNALENNGTIN